MVGGEAYLLEAVVLAKNAANCMTAFGPPTPRGPTYGIHSAGFDDKDQRHLGDKAPPRVVRLDPEPGEQREA